MKRKPIMEHIGAFLEGRGFYIALALCISALGVSAYYLYDSLNLQNDVPVVVPTQVVITPVKPTIPPTATPTPTPKPTATPTPTPEPTATSEPSATPTVAQPAAEPLYLWPVAGEVIADYSLEVLAYDETMGDWRVHCGLDIAATLGTQVQAMSDGEVVETAWDDLMGTTVTIDHGDGLSSYYANLAETPTVEVGDRVYAGTVIGAVGDTAVAESGRPDHLHFELRQDEMVIDPARVLPEY